jgi:glyoxylase-like metal-dependent hydrolase (beta-lactamase superfamily II)
MLERIKCGVVNCYLLTGSDGSVLVDVAKLSDATRIYRRVKDKNVRMILLTHGHPDHIDGASTLARLLRVPVAMNTRDADLLQSTGDRKLRAHTVLGKILAFSSKFTLSTKAPNSLSPDIWLESDQTLLEYGIQAQIVALPGHTKGSIGVLTSDGDFVVGDALFNILRPTASLLYEDREQMEKSVETIIRSGARLLHPGHGQPFTMDKIHPLG